LPALNRQTAATSEAPRCSTAQLPPGALLGFLKIDLEESRPLAFLKQRRYSFSPSRGRLRYTGDQLVLQSGQLRRSVRTKTNAAASPRTTRSGSIGPRHEHIPQDQCHWSNAVAVRDDAALICYFLVHRSGRRSLLGRDAVRRRRPSKKAPRGIFCCKPVSAPMELLAIRGGVTIGIAICRGEVRSEHPP
jgi:hypothetical protein